ncbi:hypothetical protein Gasu2_49430 [Galdieria sulphuraria]|uniref:Uncharacterized protein n=1 Tax=Galdieria sulphuraria TaxID=130081 RepID=M2Y413_GALSU|nr:uncharacterized protein Gasu_19430 [Galdieria sulphuraria]EME30698.1 hypothetical protein Gasu_19430 [Galdieria sulphuraria]GJD10773.1 hypothetical protein Gasu2_49430 [Galdieria sulphuraria]|eukprot:XP_005707218.1 hypothetical protein Gasu_19430 [Galdieria sulphuraria]
MAVKSKLTLVQSIPFKRSFSIKAIVQDIVYRVRTGKIFRPDLPDYVQRFSEVKNPRFHTHLQENAKPLVPQGPYKQVFDIQYYSRDTRRKIQREQVEPVKVFDPSAESLPPVPGRAKVYIDRGFVPNRGNPEQATE